AFDTAGNQTGQTSTTYDYALDGLFVGDMPQTSYVLGITLTPMKGLRAQIIHKTYDDHFADWSPNAREYSGDDADADRDQVWKAPGYSTMDVHVTYDLPSVLGYELQAFAHVFNALDAEYVQDAVDNSNYNGWGGTSHDADNAEVFLGTPRYFNLGLKVHF
ncbi:MAG: TonB-dependent receptor, partial [Candidatus Marinimicrobia bacterium]|nr:TonB-dependent receptor [Candidatus Neomarinimicrobiota bacterium]